MTCTFINVAGAVEDTSGLGVELCTVCGTPRPDAPARGPSEAAAPPPPFLTTRGGLPPFASFELSAARRPVAADGNCLFVALAYLLRGSRPDAPDATAAAAAMRAVCAATVAADPTNYPDAALEKPRAEYGAWIARPDVWGGAIELSILAQRGGDEAGQGAASFEDVVLHCVDVRSGPVAGSLSVPS